MNTHRFSRNVDTTEPIAGMSVEDVLAGLREAKQRHEDAVAKMDGLIVELGYAKES